MKKRGEYGTHDCKNPLLGQTNKIFVATDSAAGQRIGRLFVALFGNVNVAQQAASSATGLATGLKGCINHFVKHLK